MFEYIIIICPLQSFLLVFVLLFFAYCVQDMYCCHGYLRIILHIHTNTRCIIYINKTLSIIHVDRVVTVRSNSSRQLKHVQSKFHDHANYNFKILWPPNEFFPTLTELKSSFLKLTVVTLITFVSSQISFIHLFSFIYLFILKCLFLLQVTRYRTLFAFIWARLSPNAQWTG